MKKLYSLFEKTFGFIYHPVVRFYRFNGYKPKDFLSFVRYYVFGAKCSSDEKKYLYLDVTYLSKCERFAGICRVVSKIQEFLPVVQNEYEIVPVTGKQFLGFYELNTKKIVVPSENDVFLSAEVTQGIADSNNRFFRKIQKRGCKLVFFLHDLIPVLFPEFNGSMKFYKYYEKYLAQLAKADGVICNSNSVLKDFKKYIDEKKIKTNKNLKMSYTHLGVDFKPVDFTENLRDSETIDFLMVSTVEVRKMYDLAVQAFDILWKKQLNVTLSIVGKYGWKAEKAKALIENNEQLGKKLFWYNQGISDKELTEQYQKCDCVIFASKTEGFGLALIEAAIYKKPLIIRDIPIFREVAQDNAFYFEGNSPENLAEKIEEWISLYKAGNYPKSDGIKYISWQESVLNIFNFIEDL